MSLGPTVSRSREVCTVKYRGFQVDRGLPHAVLDRLNDRLRRPRLWIWSVCAGHSRGLGNRQAHVILRANKYEDLRKYLTRLSLTDYEAKVWHCAPWWFLQVEREESGRAPRRWWIGLADLLLDEIGPVVDDVVRV